MSNARIEKIQAHYAAEEGRRLDKVTRASDLPLSYEAITNEWLTDALCQGHPGAAVTGFELGPPDSGSANRRKISVSYNAAGRAAGLPDKLFCKATHDLANRIVLGVSGGAAGEVDFYNHIRPLLDIEAPVSVFAGIDRETINSIVMMLDLSDSVTSFCDHTTAMPRARLESQLRLLARVHAAGMRDPVKSQLHRIATWPEFFEKTYDFGMEAGSNKGFLDAESVIPPRMFARFPEVWPRMVDSVMMHRDLPHTMIHGDVHLKNWYIAGDGEMGLSDWQCCHRGHWGRDMCYTITSALPVEERRASERDLIAFYLEALASEGGPRIGFDEAWLHHRRNMMSALTWWTITLAPTGDIPDMQPKDITLEMVRRLATACDDLDSLDSF